MRLKRAGLLTKLVIVVLLVYLATSLLDLRGQIQSVQEERDTLEQQVEEPLAVYLLGCSKKPGKIRVSLKEERVEFLG